MRTTMIDGKEYACVPMDAVERFKETVEQCLMFPEASSPYPLDAVVFAAKDIFREDWPVFMLKLRAAIEESTCDRPNPNLEESERPYTREEHMAVLSRYLSPELMEDYLNGEL